MLTPQRRQQMDAVLGVQAPVVQPTVAPTQPVLTPERRAQMDAVLNPPKERSLGGFVENVGKSGAEVVKGIGNAIAHPIKTAGTMLDIANGVLGKALPQSMRNQQSDQTVNSVVDFYKQRYGKDLSKTLYEDPVGVLLDASTVLGGAGGLVKGAGKLGTTGTRAATSGANAVNLASRAAKVGRASTQVSRAGSGLIRASEAIDPLLATQRAVIRTGAGVINKMKPQMVERADKMVTSGLGNPMKQANAEKKFGRSTASFIDEYGLYDRNPATAREVVETIGKNFDTASMQSGKQVSIGKIVQAFDDKIDELKKGTGGVISDNTRNQIAELERRKQMLLDSVTQTGTEAIPAPTTKVTPSARKVELSDEPYTFTDKNLVNKGEPNAGRAIKVDGKVVGGYEMGWSDVQGVERIEKLEILPKYRRKGIATETLNELFQSDPNMNLLKGQGINSSRNFWGSLGQKEANLRLQRSSFYKKTGLPDKSIDIKAKIVAEAVKQGHNSPEFLASKLSERYILERESKAAIDAIADSVAAEIPGARVAKADLKGFKPDGSFDPKRAIEKIVESPGGDVSELKDISRNSIIVSSVDEAQQALQSILGKDKDIIYNPQKNFFDTPTYLGYRGINLNWRNPRTGYLSEIQINIPEIMYIKEPPEISRFFMSPDKFSELQKSNLTAGMGHKVYETVREYESTAIKEGRFTKRADGFLDIQWTKSEEKIVKPLIEQSKRFYDEAFELATSETAPRKSSGSSSRLTSEPEAMKSAIDGASGRRSIEIPPPGRSTMAAKLPSNSKNAGNFIQESPPLSTDIIPSASQAQQVPKVLTGSTNQTLFSPINVGVDELTTFRRKVIDPDVPKSEFGLSPKDTGRAGGVKASRDIIRAQTIEAVPELQKLGMDYGMAKEVAKIMEASAARLSNRQRFNFTKLGSAGIGMWLKGIPGLIGGFAAEQIVNSPKFSEIASKILRAAGEAKSPKAPAVFGKAAKATYLFGKAGRFSNPNQETTEETKVKQPMQKRESYPIIPKKKTSQQWRLQNLK